MKRRLTPKTIEALPPAVNKRYEVHDQLLPGLHVRVSATGRKVFGISRRINGRMKRIRIGAYPIVSLADARDKARDILRDIELGQYDEASSSVAEPALRSTLGDIIPDFIEKHAKRHTKEWKGTERVLMRMNKLHPMRIDTIKRADVIKELERLISDIKGKGGKGTRANRGLAAIKKLYSWCIDQGIVEISPVAGLKPRIKEIARDRVLSDDELIAIYGAGASEGFPFEHFLKLLILTGQRRGEVAGMRWSELDLDKGIWTLPAKRAKNATSHIVPLAPLAIFILKSVPRFQGSDLVFTTTGDTPISGFGRLKERLDVAVSLDAEDWRFHDLRRTMATNMAMLRVAPHIIEAVLNHKTGIVSGVAATYNRHAYLDEKREALELWAKKVEEMTKTKSSATSALLTSPKYLGSNPAIQDYQPSAIR